MPRLDEIPPGCPFHPRCADAFDRCRTERPELMPAGDTDAACWLYAAPGGPAGPAANVAGSRLPPVLAAAGRET
jgi:peptide/nickel transport system ATP-binding protein